MRIWKWKLLSRVQLFAVPQIVAHQAPLSMEFCVAGRFFFFFKPSEPPGKPWKYWSALPFLSLGDLPSAGIKPRSPTLQAILYHLSGKESPCNEGTAGGVASVLALGRSAGGGHGNPLQYYPLQYSCLENPMDWGACLGDATVQGGLQMSCTRLGDQTTVYVRVTESLFCPWN